MVSGVASVSGTVPPSPVPTVADPDWLVQVALAGRSVDNWAATAVGPRSHNLPKCKLH